MYEVNMKITFFTFQRQQWETKLQLGACWKGRWWPETGHKLVSTMAWYFAWVENTRGSLVPCQRHFFLVKKMHDSILEFRILHCKFTCRTLGEEDTCMETTSNISSAWTPTNLGHEIGNVLQVQSFAIGKLLREMRPDGTLFCRVSWI